MPLQHGQFIKYMQRLGYRSNSTGICFGLAYMGLQAILCEDLESFEKHLEHIEEDIANNDRLGSLIAEADIRKISWMTKDEIQKLTDIRAFCDGVELHFQPQYYKDLFREDARPFLQDAMKTSPLIDSSKMTERQGLYQAASFSGVYKEQDLTKLLKLLKKNISKDNNKPIALVISSIGHSICVGYIPNTKKWVFIDANDLPPKKLNSEALVRKIKRSLRSTEKIILTGKIYSTKNNKDEVDNIILGWKNDKTYERIQTVTPEKARYFNNQNHTWLHHAARVGDLLLTQDLLEKGANVDVIAANGWTALMVAAQNGHFEVVKVLIANDSDVDLKNADGCTPLMLASYYGHLEVVITLIAKGADVDAIESDGWSALMYSAQNSHFEVVRVLIANGANVNMQDKDGNSALTLASPELREAMLNQIETQNEAASRKKLTFSDSRGEEADSNNSPTVSHKPSTSKP